MGSIVTSSTDMSSVLHACRSSFGGLAPFNQALHVLHLNDRACLRKWTR
jgi:hypothetical protein